MDRKLLPYRIPMAVAFVALLGAVAAIGAAGSTGPVLPVVLTIGALAVAVGFDRVSRSSPVATRADRAATTTELAKAVTRGAHAPTVLSSLAQRACEIVGVEVATIATRDRARPDEVIIVAGCGTNPSAVGQHFPADAGLVGRVLASEQPQLVSDDPTLRWVMSRAHGRDLFACGGVPIVWEGKAQGVLAAASTDPAHLFGESELAILARLAELGAAAIEHAEIRYQLEQAVESSVEAMAHAIAMRDKYTGRHSDDVVGLAVAVGERFELEREAMIDLRFGALLHDLGKIAMPDAILHKNGALDDHEWQIVQKHPALGAEMLRHVSGLERVADIVRAEHERWDGAGYPDGLAASEIPLESRIVFACDAFDAMTTDRPYRPAMSPQSAASELEKCAGSQFDPLVVDKLLEVLGEHPSMLDADSRSFAVAG